VLGVKWFTDKFPTTVDAAVDKLIADMSFKDRTWIANLDEEKLVAFHASYGIFLRNEFRLWGNEPLLRSCREMAGLKKIDAQGASYVILKEMQRKLQNTNVLRVVK
jgi:hypothetical protein